MRVLFQGAFYRSRASADSEITMSLAYIVLIILLIVYVPIWFWAWRRPDAAARWHLQKYGPCLMIRTQLGMKTMDRFARYPRFWHAFGFASKLVSAILFLLMMYMLIVAVIALPARLSSGSSIGIEYALAIPGFNPIMPLSYGVVALVIAMVVHELGHGIQARVNGMRVDSSGLLYGVVPLGAFVEPNEEDLEKAPRKAQLDVYAAGITVNTIVAILSIFVMIGACGCVSSDYGDNAGAFYIDSDSPAYDAGIPASALIISVKESGTDAYVPVSAISSGTAAYLDYAFDPTKTYDIIYRDSGGEHIVGDVRMGAYIKALTAGGPADSAGLKLDSFIYSIDGHVLGGPGEFMDFMASTIPGQTVSIVTVDRSGSLSEPVCVLLGSKGSNGILGVTVTTGGMTFTTPNILLEKAVNPFYGAEGAYGHVQSFFSYLSGPFNGMDPISDEVKWWYDVPIGDIFWMFITLMYWLFWLDILLAISNALPTYILDGGFIFAGGVNWLLEKLKVAEDRREKLTQNIAGSVSSVTLFLFMLVILAMVI